MDIDISVPACLYLLCRQEKLLVKLLVKLVKYQAPFRGDKRRVGIGVLLIPDIHDGLALFVNVIHHAHEILLIISIIAVALRHNRLHVLKGALDNVVHDRNRNLACLHLVNL